MSPTLLHQGKPNNFGLTGHISPALMLNAKSTDRMHKYTKPAHREPLSLRFHCMHWQSPTSPSNCPEYKLEYFSYETVTDGRETLFHPVQGHLSLLASTSTPDQNHFPSLTPLVNRFTTREPEEQLCCAPGSGLPGTALHQTQQRGEGGCSNSTELRELRVTQGECTFFPLLNLASFRGH